MTEQDADEAPLVVVVTPTYNGARYLRETMDSVQAQTWPNLIHLVLDNASTDGTAALLAEYAGARVPVQVIRNAQTLPQKANWNAAFRHVPASARYVRLLCDDDTITPDSIERMARLAETDPEITVVGGLHDCAGAVQDFRWPADRQVFGGAEAVRMALLGEGKLMPVQMLWRKSAVDARTPLFDDYMKTGWDMDAAYAMIAGGKYGFVHACVGFTRVHAGTVTAQLVNKSPRVWTRDALDLLRKYGPLAFGPAYPRELRRFRRYYVRRMLLWKRQGDGLDIHLDALKRAGWRWSPLLVADAMLAWALQRLGLQRNWPGYPGWQ